ncbi:sulfate/molybdate ABC transporter ATP-binding protein [Roseococcus pinisoli]|uniref:ATP-binding cassette domain-containing protein n=1 Tax=Roseococcus pinisoli TaxID=2835040 RepID=A0ABS5QDW7_9PROT|nr:ATP-binding cassette domain-containing protein [Roseococcus pinisoli]MBS7811663.1 ATP-binding cassette domain-containing protein [Roseococcus pinisoli]
MTVEAKDVERRFGPMAALQGISVRLQPGEFVALLGPSGSGKTTLLRILAGLDTADAGTVRIGGRDMAGVPARHRRIGVVFQNYALFRHMTVFENVAFGLRVRPRAERPYEAELKARVLRLLELVQIPDLANRYPEQISGGQRQRAALARALAIEPELLLLDEPFGALDAVVRKDVRRWLRGLHEQLGITSLLVTHDQEEAMEMADRIAVMDRGRIAQFASPRDLLDAPASAFVAGFVGEATRIPCIVESGIARFAEPGFDLLHAALPDGPAHAFVRPADVRAEAGVSAVVRARLGGGGTRLLVEVGGRSLEAETAPGADQLDRGAPCRISLRGAWIFAETGERARGLPLGAPPRLRSYTGGLSTDG